MQAPGIVLLIRHAATAAMNVALTGRCEGVPLTADGLRQAQQLAASLATIRLAAVYSSPLQRAIETAEPIAAAHGRLVRIDEALAEVDFGEWTGLTFAELDRRPDWQAYNNARASAVVPGGKQPRQTQARGIAAIADLAAAHPGEIVAAVTHAELIRYVLLEAYGAPLDAWATIQVFPASVSMTCARPPCLSAEAIAGAAWYDGGTHADASLDDGGGHRRARRSRRVRHAGQGEVGARRR